MSLMRIGLAVATMALFAAIPAFAQSPTGTISGHLVDATGLALPGVTVTLASPNLQGGHVSRSASDSSWSARAGRSGWYHPTHLTYLVLVFAFLGSSAAFTYLNSTGPCPYNT